MNVRGKSTNSSYSESIKELIPKCCLAQNIIHMTLSHKTRNWRVWIIQAVQTHPTDIDKQVYELLDTFLGPRIKLDVEGLALLVCFLVDVEGLALLVCFLVDVEGLDLVGLFSCWCWRACHKTPLLVCFLVDVEGLSCWATGQACHKTLLGLIWHFCLSSFLPFRK